MTHTAPKSAAAQALVAERWRKATPEQRAELGQFLKQARAKRRAERAAVSDAVEQDAISEEDRG